MSILRRRTLLGMIVLALFSGETQAAPNASTTPVGSEGRMIQFYGFILPRLIYADRAVESYGNQNTSAVTAAANPVVQSLNSTQNLGGFTGAGADPNDSRASFQLAQSRAGVRINPGERVRGVLEFDFIDFTKSSPLTTMVPRVRQAYVEYSLGDEDIFSVGQFWDAFGPVGPFTYNVVGRMFLAGDIAFMRDQLSWTHKTTTYEATIAAGLQGANRFPGDNNLELNQTPTAALRLNSLLPDGGGFYGFSTILTSLLVDRNRKRQLFAYGVSGHLDLNILDHKLGVRAKGYFGRNLANLGLLSLAFGNAASDVGEVGGFLSLKYKFDNRLGLYAGGGLAQVLNTASMPNIAQGGPGIEQNMNLMVGLDYPLADNLMTFLEVNYYRTRHHLQGLTPNPTPAGPVQTANQGPFAGQRLALTGTGGLSFTF